MKNFQDYEFTRLNTYKKKEMSEELTIILSNNYYWNQFLEIIGSPVKPCVWIWINPINLLNQLNHPKGVCFYINKFLRND